MELSTRQEKVLEFVKFKHRHQQRRYTGKPYWVHLVAVAEIVSEYQPELIEIALCHDLVEDTDCTESELRTFLASHSYTDEETNFIASGVMDLTDVYTHENYPELNRAERKKKEAERLGNISAAAQTVKYADLIDNSSSIVEHDENFAKVFLREKSAILRGMRQGHPKLLKRCEAQTTQSS